MSMGQNEYDVFISYSRKDENIANEICELLTENSISYWMDRINVPAGSEFMGEIVDAIKKSKITLFISSEESNKSLYTAKEIAFAFNAGKYIIPYKIDNSSFNNRLEFILCDLNRIDAIPYSRQKSIQLVSDIKALLYGERQREVITNMNREYIDVEKWDEPSNRFLCYIKHLFDDK